MKVDRIERLHTKGVSEKYSDRPCRYVIEQGVENFFTSYPMPKTELPDNQDREAKKHPLNITRHKNETDKDVLAHYFLNKLVQNLRKKDGQDDQQILAVEKHVERIQERILTSYSRYIGGIIRRRLDTVPPQVTFDDLFSVASVALYECLLRYNPYNGTGASFKSYMTQRVTGSIKDYIRKELKHLGVGKTSTSLYKIVMNFVQTHQKPPLPAELLELGRSKGLHFSMETAENAINWYHRGAPAVSLSGLEEKDLPSKSIADPLTPLDILIEKEEPENIRRALEALTPKEAYVIRSYYLHGLTLREIGENFADVFQQNTVSESRICQIRDQAIRKLRSKKLRELIGV